MAKQFKSLLNSNQELRPLLAKTLTLSNLQRHFIDVAPSCFASSSQVLNLQSGILSIAVGNTALAAKLRQLAPELAILLQNRGCEVSGIRVKVQVSFGSIRPDPVPRQLGAAAQNALTELSRNLKDSPLKLVLKRMVKGKN